MLASSIKYTVVKLKVNSISNAKIPASTVCQFSLATEDFCALHKDSFSIQTLSKPQWQEKIDNHLLILSDTANSHVKRANSRIKHPVFDFLFSYYSFRAAKLLQFSPGIRYQCEQAGNSFDAITFGKKSNNDSFIVDASALPKKRLNGLQRAVDILVASYQRTPYYGCFGLHEWAMIYDKADIRHAQLSLRFSHQKIRAIVEEARDNQLIKCSHYDAFRFFSRSASSFNRLNLDKDNQENFEQAGCLHANMDIYRWAYKYYPWVDSDLIREAFLLAQEIRAVDMRASPYDLSDYNLAPIAIETAEGKKEYIAYQQYFYKKAQPLRLALILQLQHLAKNH